jgi:hypothetical protein
MSPLSVLSSRYAIPMLWAYFGLANTLYYNYYHASCSFCFSQCLSVEASWNFVPSIKFYLPFTIIAYRRLGISKVLSFCTLVAYPDMPVCLPTWKLCVLSSSYTNCIPEGRNFRSYQLQFSFQTYSGTIATSYFSLFVIKCRPCLALMYTWRNWGAWMIAWLHNEVVSS